MASKTRTAFAGAAERAALLDGMAGPTPYARPVATITIRCSCAYGARCTCGAAEKMREARP
jgi:hypothetical protein